MSEPMRRDSSDTCKLSEASIPALIDVFFVITKAFLTLGTPISDSLRKDSASLYENICIGRATVTYLELLNDSDLLWSALLVCITELSILSPAQAQRLVSASDTEVLNLSYELSLAHRKLLGALFAGLSFILETSRLAVSVSLLQPLLRALLPSLDDRDEQLRAFFNLAATSQSVFFYYDPFASRLGRGGETNTTLTWRGIQRTVEQLCLKSSALSVAPKDNSKGVPAQSASKTPMSAVVLKGVTMQDLRALFDKSLSLERDPSGNLCADLG